MNGPLERVFNKKIMSLENQIEKLISRYHTIGENPESYIKGFTHAKPINYWDYISLETLLSLQRPRTNFKDEEIFIMYHQVTELFLKMMIHEIKQLSENPFNENVWLDKTNRLCRYTQMLINSFDVMKYGMNYEDYNEFRYTLTPASGFQSVQFRIIEIMCTPLKNLINESGKLRIKNHEDLNEIFENLYWQDAGNNRETGKKTYTLKQFEEKYLEDLMSLSIKMQGKTLEEIIQNQSNISEELTHKLKEFDYLYNIKWPMVHLETAQHYLDSKGENKTATGGSEWKKYLHPKYQKRRFFPKIWTLKELINWGTNE